MTKLDAVGRVQPEDDLDACRFMLEEASVVVLLFSPEGLLLKTNAFAEELLGPSEEARTLSQVFVDFEAALNLKDLAAEADNPLLLNLNCAQGPPQSFYFKFSPIGENTLALGQPDYSELELLRKSLVDLTGELSNANRQLQKSNNELEVLNGLKNQFIGMAAHDLRNPIGQIMVCSEFLLEEAAEPIDREKLELLEIIKNSSKFMLSLIDDLLDLSVIESGRLNLEPSPVDILDLVKQNVELNGILSAKRKVRLTLKSYEEFPTMLVDPAKINQVLNNLLSNAIKFSPVGGEVSIFMYKTDRQVMISVKDQGPGIPEKEIDRLFKPFGRTSAKNTSGEKSTGLGLAIAHRIIIGHKGRLWVENEAGGGAAFHFTLPMVREEDLV